ncbi:MAG: 30S ribosomal protein S12 methylthiotransferase RimO [Oscillospiraceae bacterium]|nr:30S ribosomal protein S12 methylthiotransferase RimO [Oscillospiraceae bacterium]
MVKRIGFVSLGCAKNLVNSEQMMHLCDEAGYDVSGETENVDAVIVNTCGFIDSAKSEAIEIILDLAQAKEAGSIGKIIVTGCMAQRYPQDILDEMPEVDAIIGTGSYNSIVDVIERTLAGETVVEMGDINAPEKETGRVLTTSPLWEYIKIAEGCDNRCAYCIIPYLRGKYRSRDFEDVVAEAKSLAEAGIKELIVVAQDITRYGKDLYGKRRLAELLREFCKIDGIEWIRLHYLYPDEIDDDLIEVIATEDKILKYLDIPIQHISANILKTMCRRGTGDEIRELFKKLRERIPGLVLRTSLIAGLPGEGEEQFEELCEFLLEAKIERAGVFPFSPEEGTPAEKMERPDTEIAQKRAELVMEVQSRIMDEYNESRVGKEFTVLVEDFDGTYYSGRSYAESPDIDGRIVFVSDELITDDFAKVLITDIIDGEPFGKAV